MDKMPDGSHLVLQLFREGKGFPYESRNTLSECAVVSFDMICLSGFLADSVMTAFRKDGCISFPKIGVKIGQFLIVA